MVLSPGNPPGLREFGNFLILNKYAKTEQVIGSGKISDIFSGITVIKYTTAGISKNILTDLVKRNSNINYLYIFARNITE